MYLTSDLFAGSCVRGKSEKVFRAHVSLFIRHLCEPVPGIVFLIRKKVAVVCGIEVFDQFFPVFALLDGCLRFVIRFTIFLV